MALLTNSVADGRAQSGIFECFLFFGASSLARIGQG